MIQSNFRMSFITCNAYVFYFEKAVMETKTVIGLGFVS